MKRVICEKEKCTGCFACMNTCPKNAISVVRDERGKTVPEINEDICVNCGLCTLRCPANNPVETNPSKKCYAVQWKSEDRVNCSSGGVATGIYNYCYENGIHIFGSKFTDDFTLEICELKNKDDINLATGSKYVQSSVGMSYRSVKQILSEGEKVLYIGTPCQIDGLYHYLGNRPEALVTIDIVCHGVPPVVYLNDYIKSLGVKDVNRVSFRGKDDYYLCLYNHEDVIYKKWQKRDLYFHAFNEGMINRDNCYNCRYANSNRVADITIGDFWGLKRQTLKKKMSGKISVVLINSEHGDDFWNTVNAIFDYEEREVAEAVKGNPHLKKCTPKNKTIEDFETFYPELGFKKAILKTGIRKRMLRMRLRELKWSIKKAIVKGSKNK